MPIKKGPHPKINQTKFIKKKQEDYLIKFWKDYFFDGKTIDNIGNMNFQELLQELNHFANWVKKEQE